MTSLCNRQDVYYILYKRKTQRHSIQEIGELLLCCKAVEYTKPSITKLLINSAHYRKSPIALKNPPLCWKIPHSTQKSPIIINFKGSYAHSTKFLSQPLVLLQVFLFSFMKSVIRIHCFFAVVCLFYVRLRSIVSHCANMFLSDRDSRLLNHNCLDHQQDQRLVMIEQVDPCQNCSCK